MKCIDKDLSTKDINARIQKFIDLTMSESEQDIFAQHLDNCKHCESKMQKMLNDWNKKEVGETYIKLCLFYGKKDWEEVVRLGNEMRLLGYDEQKFKINDMMQQALETLYDKSISKMPEKKKQRIMEFNEKFFPDNITESEDVKNNITILTVYVNGKIVKQVPLSDKIEVPLSETGKVEIKDGDKVVFEKVIKFPKKIEKKAPLNFREERKAAFKTYKKTEEKFEYLGKNISVIFDIGNE